MGTDTNVQVPIAAPAFAAWLDDFFATYYRQRPVNATFIGVHDHDDRLPDLTGGGLGELEAQEEGLLRRLRALPPEPLSGVAALDRRLAEGFLEMQRWERRSTHFARGNPAYYTGEAVFGVIALFLRPFAPLAQRVEAAIARMAAIPALLVQGRTNVRAAPPAWTERAVRECSGALAFFGRGVDRLIAEHNIADRRVCAATDRAAAAFAAFEGYLTTDLRRRSTGASACGEEAFDLLLRRGHFLAQDAASIDAYAREQLALCQDRLAEEAAGFGVRTPAEALAGLADRHPPAAGYYGRYGEVWAAARAVVEEHRLLTWPAWPLRYIPQPRWTREAAPHLYFLPYRSPAPYDHASGVDYLDPPVEPDLPPDEQERRLRTTNDSVIKLNHVIHHGGGGHHVQNWHAARAASRIGRVAAVDCASRIAMVCGGTMAEGWACYATDLLGEIGVLTPLERYSLHHARLRMAARAIVNVKLHTGAFGLDEATACYRDLVGMSPEASGAEAVKSSMFPGTAVMYLLGTDQIHDLRRDLTARAGAAFDLRRFHDRLLAHGSVPISLIAAAMREETAPPP